jgi:phospholipid/cholesterol/gamma-HCH transport system substrate-binding protein
VRGFGQVMAPYDANGHYARTEPVFDAYTLTETPEGGELRFKPIDQRGSAPGFTSGNLRRCPGAAAPATPDGSSPFVDNGPLANPDCDAQQRPGNGR